MATGALQWLGVWLVLQQALLAASAPAKPCPSAGSGGVHVHMHICSDLNARDVPNCITASSAMQLFGVWSVLQEALLAASAPAGSRGVHVHVNICGHPNAMGSCVLEAQLQSAGANDNVVESDATQRECELNSNGGVGDHQFTLTTEAAVLGGASEDSEFSDAAWMAAYDMVLDEALKACELDPNGCDQAPNGNFQKERYADYRPLDDADNATVKGLYKLHAGAKPWAEARAACEAEHARLLVAETAAEAAAATRAFLRGPAPVGADRADLFFVGFSDEWQEGQYVTVTGKNLTSLEFQSWHPREPSKGRDQNYGALDRNGKMHDIPNSWKLAFMCEAPPNFN